jgi:hypothetical protein
VRVLNPKKGETRWQPGYQVISSHVGALRVLELATGNVIRLNQRHVREIPESKPYEEIDPIPEFENPVAMDFPVVEAKPVPLPQDSYLPTRIPCTDGAYSSPVDTHPLSPEDASVVDEATAIVASAVLVCPFVHFPFDDWSSWCDTIYHYTHSGS